MVTYKKPGRPGQKTLFVTLLAKTQFIGRKIQNQTSSPHKIVLYKYLSVDQNPVGKRSHFLDKISSAVSPSRVKEKLPITVGRKPYRKSYN